MKLRGYLLVSFQGDGLCSRRNKTSALAAQHMYLVPSANNVSGPAFSAVLAGLLAVLVAWSGGCTARQDSPTVTSSSAQPPAAVSPAPPPPAPAPAVEPPKPSELPPHAELPSLEGDNWQSLFDGSSMSGWQVTDFAGHGAAEVKEGQLVLEMGAMLTGVNLVRTNDLPVWDYELALDAMKVDGQDFFCGLTFVVGDSCCSLIVGGWGGGLVGISSLDGSDASMNETTKYKAFESNRWYRIRVSVTREKLEAWIGKEKMANVKLEGKRISVRPGEIESSQPFGIATFQTTGAFRSIQWRSLK